MVDADGVIAFRRVGIAEAPAFRALRLVALRVRKLKIVNILKLVLEIIITVV